jgi:hypothetical protein
VAYLDGAVVPHPLCGLEIQAVWLIRRPVEILDTTLINSEELNRWAARASRRLFGQERPR